MEKDKNIKKYELTDEVVIVDGLKLHRIRALRSFGDVKAGDLGGFIQKEKNLSHEGNAWVYSGAKVSRNAVVYGNAKVYDNAIVSENAIIYENARVHGNAIVEENSRVFGNARVHGNAAVSGNAYVCGNANVSGNAWIYGDSEVFGNAVVSGDAWVYQNAVISGNAKVSGNVQVSGNAYVCGNALISLYNHFLTVGPIGSQKFFATFFRTAGEKIGVSCGCFQGYLDEFINEVKETDIDKNQICVYEIITELAKLQINCSI